MSVLLYPPFLQWEVVSDCNHKCIHCYNYWRADNIPVDKCEHFEEITDKIIERKPLYVALTGGEPFLVFPEIKNCILKMRKAGLAVSLSTNGTLITEEHIPFLAENNIDLVVSLPSIDHDVCDAVCNSQNVVKKLLNLFTLLQKYKITTTINIVLTKLNLPTLPITLKSIAKYNFLVRVGIAQRPINASKDYLKYELNREDFDYIVKQCIKAKQELNLDVDISVCLPDCAFKCEEDYLSITNGTCFAGATAYALTTKGEVKACQCDDKTYGNILTDDFEEIYQRMSSWRDGSLIPKECLECNKLDTCRGGCRVEAYASKGDYRALPTFADLHNVPVKFNSKESLCDYSNDTVFTVDKEAIFLEDKECYRVSVGRTTAIHLAKDFAEWLSIHSSFSFSELTDDCQIDPEDIKVILNMLHKNKIIEVKTL